MKCFLKKQNIPQPDKCDCRLVGKDAQGEIHSCTYACDPKAHRDLMRETREAHKRFNKRFKEDAEIADNIKDYWKHLSGGAER